MDAKSVSIPLLMNSHKLVVTAECIGLVYPTHGHEMPNMVKEFIRKALFNTDYLYWVQGTRVPWSLPIKGCRKQNLIV